MQLLKKRILQDGKCYEGGILKVDGFINLIYVCPSFCSHKRK